MTATKPLPPHGTYARANGRFYADIPPCECPPCREVGFRYEKQRRIDKAAGRDRTIPAARTARDVEYLASVGMTYLDIATAAQCSKSSIYNWRKPGARINARLANRIAAIRASYSANKPVAAFGAIRRVRAAVAAGHPQAAFAAASGLSVSYVCELASGRPSTVLAGTWNRVNKAYQELIAGPAPEGIGATRSRRRAAAAGWPTPEQWDDRIDDLEANPAAWARGISDGHTAEELVADANEIRRTWGDVGWDLIAERLGVPRNNLDKARERVRKRGLTTERQMVAA